MRRVLEHETRILSKPLDVSFITRIDEDWGILLSTAPVFVRDQISLLKGLITLGSISEVIEYLSVVFCFVKLTSDGNR